MRAEGGKRDLRGRTNEYALRIIRLYRALPRSDRVGQVPGKQLLRSDTSVAALIQPLREETNELIAVFVTMTKNVKKRRR